MRDDPRDRAVDGQALSTRIWLQCLASQELLCTYLGIRLGLYECLAERGPLRAAELARHAGIGERYAREWLEQQAVAGVVTATGSGAQACFELPAAHADVLTASASPLSRVASILPLGGVGGALPALLAAYRAGTGLPDAAYGDDWRDGHADANRGLFLGFLAGWLRQRLPDIHARLERTGGRIADVGCGAGWASIALARAYPRVHTFGLDSAPEMIARARANAAAAGLEDRVAFEVGDAGAVPPERAGVHDVVCLFDALHELGRPVEILRACRALAAPAGGVLILDARVARAFHAPADEIERFQYTTSVLHCLPACLADEPSHGTGTVLRPAVVAGFARQAGFTSCDELAIADRFHRLYWLVA